MWVEKACFEQIDEVHIADAGALQECGNIAQVFLPRSGTQARPIPHGAAVIQREGHARNDSMAEPDEVYRYFQTHPLPSRRQRPHAPATRRAIHTPGDAILSPI